MSLTTELYKEFIKPKTGKYSPDVLSAEGICADFNVSPVERWGNSIKTLFENSKPHIYKNDIIVGSILSMWDFSSDIEREYAEKICKSAGKRTFLQNSSHYAPNYDKAVNSGIGGILNKINNSKNKFKNDKTKYLYLTQMEKTILAFRQRIINTIEIAKSLKNTEGYDNDRLDFIISNCESIVDDAPKTFAAGLQLVWFIHTAFVYEDRYAMALGRMDIYLYDLYKSDIESGRITKADAVQMLENTFIKIGEFTKYLGFDDVVNICIGGSDIKGNSTENELSFCILEAVRNCGIPGPNLSARICENTSDYFLDECLKVIGTGLGYPALMNDKVNLAALSRFGYKQEDVQNYCMVGCIENFIAGKQPPWSDGRFDTPRFFEHIFNHGKGFVNPSKSFDSGSVDDIKSMDDFMKKFEELLKYGVREYVYLFNNSNLNINKDQLPQPFLSCFCDDCIDRGLDINDGGSVYPSVHGACLMGIGTVTDSLAAIEKVVFVDKKATLAQLGVALKANFEGYEDLRQSLLDAPKYGNNDDFADKYAVWFVKFLTGEFDKFRTPDGGRYYTAIAANTANIYAGKIIGATPDGRKACEPLSDAASPTYGRDTKGATSTINSLVKPDYSVVGTGSVVNQKFSQSMFNDEKRKKLLALIRVYFNMSGQEIQINATSREVLIDAMEHPENYENLVVRVSGFSAYYVTLAKSVQKDILNRTQQE